MIIQIKKLFRLFCTIQWSSLFSIWYWISVILSSHNMISHSWKVFYSTSSHQNHTMFLESMRFSRDICQYFCSIWKSHFCKLSLSWVWFFRSHYGNSQTNTSFKRCWFFNLFICFEFVYTKLKYRSLWFKGLLFSSFFDQLIDCWHTINKHKKINLNEINELFYNNFLSKIKRFF